MNPVVRRIAAHGVASAVVLGVFGLLLVQIAAVWLASADPDARPGEKFESAEVDAAFISALRWRVPVFVACGVAFVAACEIVTHLSRRRRAATAPAAAQPDDAEKLLEELLAKAEAARTAPPDVGVQTPPPVGGTESEPAGHQDATR